MATLPWHHTQNKSPYVYEQLRKACMYTILNTLRVTAALPSHYVTELQVLEDKAATCLWFLHKVWFVYNFGDVTF